MRDRFNGEAMELNKHQKLVLAIAAVLAFGIWLFPHWRLHIYFGANRTPPTHN